MAEPYVVYFKLDDVGHIVAVNSSEFMQDVSGWVAVDSGYADKHLHAQGNYLKESVMLPDGVCRYKYVNGVVSPCTEAELEAQRKNIIHPLSLEERLVNLEKTLPIPDEYVVGKWYYRGDKILFNGSSFTCIAPKGVVCVWSPLDYPLYWTNKA